MPSSPFASTLQRLAWPAALAALALVAAAAAFFAARTWWGSPPGAQTALSTGGARAHRAIRWEDLVPADWAPPALPASAALAGWSDADPRAQALLKTLRQAWDKAPTVAALDGAAVRLAGYVVPLETGSEGLREFLLVPYHGACIHTPPPPSNQIVLVRMAEPVQGIKTMDVVQARGVLRTERLESAMGTSGYTMDASLLMRFGGRLNGVHTPASAGHAASR